MESKRLSKQEKKKLKYEKVRESRKKQRKRLRDAQKEKRREMLAAMTDEQRAEFVKKEREEKNLLETEYLRASQQGTPIVVDFSHSQMMSEQEQTSLVSQIRQATGFLRKRSNQFYQLLCCSVPPSIKEQYLKYASEKWIVKIKDTDLEGIEEIAHKNVIMLSPDSADPLGELDLENSVYVIGGIVDRTIKSQITLEQAMKKNLTARRLPIQEEFGSNVKFVLNVNTVIELLQIKAEGRTWRETFLEGIPKRYLKQRGIIPE